MKRHAGAYCRAAFRLRFASINVCGVCRQFSPDIFAADACRRACRLFSAML